MNAAQYEELLSMLNDIGFRLQRLEKRLFPATAEAPAASKPQAAATAQAPQQPPAYEVATDDDLDGQYGNPEIRKDPPRWTGESFVGCRFSEASPEYLETLAGFLDWKARESDKKDERVKGGGLKSRFIRLDAARARGWAARIRGGTGARSTAHTSSKEAREQREASGYQPPPQPEPPPLGDFGEEDIPF
jgi:hypothetical protein